MPLNLEPGAVKQYAQSMEALKRKATPSPPAARHSTLSRARPPEPPAAAGTSLQVGIPPVEDVIGATLDHQLACSGGSVRGFLQSATEGVSLGKQSEVLAKVYAALDRVEAQSGPAEAGNEAGLKALEREVQVRGDSLHSPSGAGWRSMDLYT